MIYSRPLYNKQAEKHRDTVPLMHILEKEDTVKGYHACARTVQENHFGNSRVQKHIYSNGNLQELVHFRQNKGIPLFFLR